MQYSLLLLSLVFLSIVLEYGAAWSSNGLENQFLQRHSLFSTGILAPSHKSPHRFARSINKNNRQNENPFLKRTRRTDDGHLLKVNPFVVEHPSFWKKDSDITERSKNSFWKRNFKTNKNANTPFWRREVPLHGKYNENSFLKWTEDENTKEKNPFIREAGTGYNEISKFWRRNGPQEGLPHDQSSFWKRGDDHFGDRDLGFNSRSLSEGSINQFWKREDSKQSPFWRRNTLSDDRFWRRGYGGPVNSNNNDGFWRRKKDPYSSKDSFWKRGNENNFWKRKEGSDKAFWRRSDNQPQSDQSSQEHPDNHFWKRKEPNGGSNDEHFARENKLPENAETFWKRNDKDESFWKRGGNRVKRSISWKRADNQGKYPDFYQFIPPLSLDVRSLFDMIDKPESGSGGGDKTPQSYTETRNSKTLQERSDLEGTERTQTNPKTKKAVSMATQSAIHRTGMQQENDDSCAVYKRIAPLVKTSNNNSKNTGQHFFLDVNDCGDSYRAIEKGLRAICQVTLSPKAMQMKACEVNLAAASLHLKISTDLTNASLEIKVKLTMADERNFVHSQRLGYTSTDAHAHRRDDLCYQAWGQSFTGWFGDVIRKHDDDETIHVGIEIEVKCANDDDGCLETSFERPILVLSTDAYKDKTF